MTILTLRYNGKNIKDYALLRGEYLTVGRNPDNGIVIDNAAVSGYHARIESVASSFIIRDLNSTNGVFVNSKRIETHALEHNDVVHIGKHELVFNRLVFDRSARADQSLCDTNFFDEKTRFLDTREHKELIDKATATAIPATSESLKKSNDTKGFLSKFWGKILNR